MGRYAYLIMVSEQNNNKFYSLREQDDGTIEIYNGRVDVSKIRQEPKPISQWDKIYNSKIKKGYKDVTHLVATTISKKGSVNYVDIDNKEVKDVIDKLIAYSKKTVEDNYKVKASAVTKNQIDEAQRILDLTSKLIRRGSDVKDINSKLLELFTVIPRKMDKVQNYLLTGDTINTKDDLENAKHRISKEQDILDSMSSSVSICATEAENESNGGVENRTILDTLGITIQPASDEDIKNIKNHLGEIKDKFRRAFVVSNIKAEKRFNDFVAKADDKKVEFFWHGSRNENFLSILQNSLMIRPSGAVYSGSMFGDGCYYSNRARKSFGYTSSKSAYWTKENSNIAYMAVFKVHVGKQWVIHEHQSYCYSLNETTVKNKGFDSVWAKAGKSLYNDEFIIYNPAQCTIKYLVELDG